MPCKRKYRYHLSFVINTDIYNIYYIYPIVTKPIRCGERSAVALDFAEYSVIECRGREVQETYGQREYEGTPKDGDLQ